MRFEKGNEYGFTSDESFAKDPLCLKVKEGVREKLRAIPGWKERLRAVIDEIIQESME